MPAWVAWYTEGRRFSGSTVEQWKALPAEGLVWLTVWTDEEHRAFYKGDWYMWDGERFGHVPPSAPGAPWGEKPEGCLSCIKKGAPVSDAEFAAIQREAWETLAWA